MSNTNFNFESLKHRLEPERETKIDEFEKTKVVFSLKKLKLLEFLYRNPCSTVSFICSRINENRNNVKWHMKALLENRFVIYKKFNRHIVFYPIDFIEGRDFSFFALINSSNGRKVWSVVSNSPGISLKIVQSTTKLNYRTAKAILDNLITWKYLNKVREGQNIMYYNTKMIDKCATRQTNRTRYLKKDLFIGLKKYTPTLQIISSTDRFFRLKTMANGKEIVLEFWMNPYKI